MTMNERQRKRLLAHCDEVRDDDGIDPREFFKPAVGRRRQEHRKTGQLCRQVAETLCLVLASEFDDPRLHNLQVVSVTPAPNAGHLLVTVASDEAGGPDDIAAIHDRLARVVGRLRSEVAAAITRKRAPGLTFRIVGTFGGEEVQS